MTVVRLEISERGPYQGGVSFGEIGPYEYLAGVMHFAIDPLSDANHEIRDLELAPTNAQGQVEQNTANLVSTEFVHGASDLGSALIDDTAEHEA